ncbi:MAG: twin-arginine translocation signal domain-containing protein [Halobacteriales archaeon]
MPCSHANSEENDRPSRRDFLRSAVAIGGTSALGACLQLENDDTSEPDPGETPTPVGTTEAGLIEQSFPQGVADPSTLPEGQHFWQDYLVTDRFGNTVLPQHQVLLFLDYVGPTPPTEAAREQVETALTTIERAFRRGDGGESDLPQHEGLLFTFGYSPSYFEKVGDDIEQMDVDLRHPTAVIDALGERGDVNPVTHDALFHFGSDFASIVLGAEAALFGEIPKLNGIPVEEDLSGLFERVERRSGFASRGQPAKQYDNEEIPEESPLSMGFKASFTDNQPPEEKVTIKDGQFAGGTTQMISFTETGIDRWYDENDHTERIHQMYTPRHTEEMVGKIGHELGDTSAKTRDDVERLEEDAREHGRVGHGQKLAQARDDDFDPILLRRDFNSTVRPGLHGAFWQQKIGEFIETRSAMNGHDLDGEVADEDHGIRHYIDVKSRATFLAPPRSQRVLPTIEQ